MRIVVLTKQCKAWDTTMSSCDSSRCYLLMIVQTANRYTRDRIIYTHLYLAMILTLILTLI